MKLKMYYDVKIPKKYYFFSKKHVGTFAENMMVAQKKTTLYISILCLCMRVRVRRVIV